MIGRYFADNNLDVFKEVPLHEGKTDTVALIAKTKENASGVFVQRRIVSPYGRKVEFWMNSTRRCVSF